VRPLALGLLVAAALAAAAGGVQGASAAGGPLVFWSCSPGPDDCSGWYRTNVTISWSYSASGLTGGSCGPRTVESDTNGISINCTLQYGASTVSTNVSIKRDSTPPEVTSANAGRAPDVNGWYNHPVAINFGGSDETSGIAGCAFPTYSGPDSGTASVAGTCNDNAGNTSGPLNFGFKYDGTPPKVTGATPSRKPDANGWFNHPVDFHFTGEDQVSGVAGCSAATYKGPDSKAAALKGTCQDNAGNTSAETPTTFKYDATAPAFPRLASQIQGGHVVLTWNTSPDVKTVLVERVLDKRGAKPKLVFKGHGRSWIDRSVRDAGKYRYAVTVIDEAGNRSGRMVRAGRSSGTAAPVTRKATRGASKAAFLPADGARVHGPVELHWAKVPKATYYNVQLRRNGVKILSIWPLSSTLVIPLSWSYGGAAQRLAPGTYRWDVWPGYGARSAAKYGKLIRTSHFVVVR
jgi:hypothetical protein